MWLIKTSTLTLHEFLGSPAIGIKYAILSHCWQEEEVSFKDFHSPTRETLKGWQKIRESSSLAHRLGHEYLWVDTCCIDKSSSSELSEAINSMYALYQYASICLVHLYDVLGIEESLVAEEVLRKYIEISRSSKYSFHDSDELADLMTSGSKDRGLSANAREQIQHAKWFSRGWTLQELLAPRRVHFLDRLWHFLGTKQTLSNQISKITAIPVEYITNPHSRWASVAQRMSWASTRSTSRPEDSVYCLLGLFNINMPLLYGEGARNAFNRLQLLIMQSSNDETLFAWRSKDISGGMLAVELSCFKDCGDIVSHSVFYREPYHMTNKGFYGKLYMTKRSEDVKSGWVYWKVPLNCAYQGREWEHGTSPRVIYIKLVRQEKSSAENSLFRFDTGVTSTKREMVHEFFRDSNTIGSMVLHKEMKADLVEVFVNRWWLTSKSKPR